MKRTSSFFVFLLAAAAASAVPVVDQGSVSVVQDGGSDRVRVKYELRGADAVVTVQVFTNGVDHGGADAWLPLGADRAANALGGDANVLVAEGWREAVFHPEKAGPWPEAKQDFRFVVQAWATNSPPDFMVVDAMGASRTKFYASADDVPGGVTNVAYKTRYFLMRRIPAAGVEWVSGEPWFATGTRGYYASRVVPVPVLLTSDFYCSAYEMTVLQREYAVDGRSEVKETVPESDLLPASVTYNQMRGTSTDNWVGWPNYGYAVASDSDFATMRSRTGVQFDFLTSAQWEFACRAGTDTSLNNGRNLKSADRSVTADDVAWYRYNTNTSSRAWHQVVGQKSANAWGLYDMHGNAAEWTLDFISDYARLGTSLHVDPVGDMRASDSMPGRCVRGGDAGSPASLLSSGMRSSLAPTSPECGVRLFAPCTAVK